MNSTSDGTTPSERYLGRLARKSFLSLWSYPNVYTDEGRKNGKGNGKELCDLLVVFDRHVLIFSDKHCEFPNGDNVEINWSRWYRRAVKKSVGQILGAKSFISRFPDRLFLDRDCQQPFPIQVPTGPDIRFHLFAVTRGAHNACRAHFSRDDSGGTGSFIINTDVVGDDHLQAPFTIGKVVPGEQYIHVLDELTLDVLLHELDTIKDLIAYLEKKEALLTHPTRAILSTGEEQLISMYLTHMDKSGEHNFAEFPDDIDSAFIDEGFWEEFIQNPQYRAKKNADEISYAWDRLIEHFIKLGEVGATEPKSRNKVDIEPSLRVMAGESRLGRRQLASQLLEALEKPVPPGGRFLRIGQTMDDSATAYVFLVVPKPPFLNTYEEYREARIALLLACCKVAKLRLKNAKIIVGLATEPHGTSGSSEDLITLNVDEKHWGNDEVADAKELQQELGILLDQNVKMHRRRDDEYPEVTPTQIIASNEQGSPADRLQARVRLRNLAKLKAKAEKKSKH